MRWWWLSSRPAGTKDASPWCCAGVGVGVMVYAGDGCTYADGGGGIVTFMLEFVEERDELRERDSCDEDAILSWT